MPEQHRRVVKMSKATFDADPVLVSPFSRLPRDGGARDRGAR